MHVGSFPHSSGGGGKVVELHTHARFLRALANEDVDGGGLLNFGGAFDELLVTLIVGLDVDDLAAVVHGEARLRGSHGQDQGDEVTSHL